jgi:hypothetical protein
MLTSEDAVEPKAGEHCNREQHFPAPDHAVMAPGNPL